MMAATEKFMRRIQYAYDALAIDVTLGVRMLVKYPALTIVGCAAMAFGIAAGIGGFEIRTQLIDPALPLHEGHRIVGLRSWDARANRLVPTTAADFATWRDHLTTIDELGAAALVDDNLIAGGASEPARVAQVTASAFRIARVLPLIGRPILDADELADAPMVAIIGHSLWQRRFSSDPGIVGRLVRIGSQPATVVGVMPAGFGFPVAHEVWTALRRETLTSTSRPVRLVVFGRLSAGASIDQARAEFATVGARATAGPSAPDEFVQGQIVPYAHLIVDPRDYTSGLALANIFLVMLIILVSANVGLLMFARAAARESEIAVRNALGASRARIVTQLFVEALVLSTLSVIAGLAAVRYALTTFWRMTAADAGGPLPFWFTGHLTASTVAYGVGLTVFGAVIVGVLPALGITGQGLQGRLRQFSSGGGGYRFGGVWTAVIAAQVAATVVFPATAFFFHRWVIEGQTRDVGFRSAEYLSARLVTDVESPSTIEELRRRFSSEPGIMAATFADRLPGTLHPGVRYEVEGDAAPPTYGYEVRVASVDGDFFAALGASPLSGRGFSTLDFVSGREVAVVNSSFVNTVFHGRDPLGRRIRRLALDDEGERVPGPWTEIVGVVRDLGVVGAKGIGLYRPLAPGTATVHVALQVRGAPESFAGRLRDIAGDVDPALRVYDVMPLNRVGADLWLESQYLSRLLVVFSAVAMLLSLSAIYSVMAFTVVQRTRDIGVWMALGAGRMRIITAIVRRPLVQIGLGIAAGGVLVVIAFVGLFDSAPTPIESGIIVAYAVLMLAVCLMACVVPTRRALGLDPSQVLRSDG